MVGWVDEAFESWKINKSSQTERHNLTYCMPLFGVPGRLAFVDFAEMATVFLAGYLLPVVCGRVRWRLGVVVW